MQELRKDELMEVNGGIGIIEGCLIVLAVTFVAGVATGALESYNENK